MTQLFSQWWWWPFLTCLVVTGTLGYLGSHVLQRKVIFVDLATAQVAALGAAYAALLGYETGHHEGEDDLAIYLFSLGFALVGAAVIALTRMRKERVPHEAFIGIVYASASALAVLVLSRTPTEGEQIKHMLVGNLQFVTKAQVLTIALVCATVGVFHWFFRRKFFLISADAEAAEKAGLSVRFWDFLFYISLGIVITSCVSVAGVLLVFSYLVVPAVIAVMFAERMRLRIPIAWGVGTAVSVVGLLIADWGNFTAGPSIVAGFTIVLVLAGLIYYVTTHERWVAAVGRVAAGAGLVALAIWGTTFLKKVEAHEHKDLFTQLVEALKSDNEGSQIEAIHHIVETKDAHAVPPLIELLKATKSDRVVEHAAKALAELGATEAVPVLKEVVKRYWDDAEFKVTVARAILDLHDPGGFPILIDVIESGEARIQREEAAKLLSERSGQKDGDVAALKKWWAEHGSTLRWHPQLKRFE